MALSDRHWIMGVVLLCGTVAALRLPPREREGEVRRMQPTTVETRARDRVRRHLRRETARLALLERRDSVLRLLAKHDASGGAASGRPMVLYDAAIPNEVRSPIEREIEREVAGVGGSLAAAPVVVHVVADTGAALAARWGSEYSPTSWLQTDRILPPGVDGRRCLAIVRVGAVVLDRSGEPDRLRRLERLLLMQAGGMLGPCAYIGAHGLPGSGIESWLTSTTFSTALRAPTPGLDAIDSVMIAASTSRVRRWLARSGWSESRRVLPLVLLRCVDGDDGACLDALAAPGREPAGRDGTWHPARRDDFGARTPLGPAEPWLMASLHDRMGAEAFGRFWRSALPPDSAFADVTGVTLATAIREWATGTYGVGPRHPWPHPWALGGQILLAGGLLGIALARRRY